MKIDATRLAFCLMALLLCAGAEELLPKLFGVGVPLLLVLVLMLSSEGTMLSVSLLAIVAGVFEDAISALPPMTSASAFLVAALAVRYLRLSWAVAILFYPLYQVWLSLWVAGLGGSVFIRLCVSLPIGVAAFGVVGTAILWAARKAAINERD